MAYGLYYRLGGCENALVLRRDRRVRCMFGLVRVTEESWCWFRFIGWIGECWKVFEAG